MSQYNGSFFAICGASFLSEFLTHPFEVLKVKSQIKYNKTGVPPTRFQTYHHFVEKNGFRALYRGFSAGFLRAAQTQIVRLNLYEEINKHFPLPEGATVWQQMPIKFGSAFVSSLVAGSTTNAWAVLKVRMITNKKGQYNTLYQTYKTVVAQDGYRELTKGTVLTLVRGVLGSAIELTAYDALKQVLKPKLGSDQLTYFISSVVASFVSAFVSYPMDVVITLYMNERTHGNEENRGLKRCWTITKEVSKKGGVKGFFVGFPGYVSRCMTYGPIFWNSLEFFNALAKKEQLQI